MKIVNLKSQILSVKFRPLGIHCLIFGIFFVSGGYAQLSQPARYERPHKNSDHEFIIISMGEKGLALVRDSEKFEGNKRTWEVTFLDSTLQEIRTAKIHVSQRMSILGHEYRDGSTYLIFQEPESYGREVRLFEFAEGDSTYKQHTFKPEVNIHFTHFSVLKAQAIFGGYINREPALLLYDLQEERARVIPGVFQPNVDLVDVRVNSNNTFNALLMEGKTVKTKKLVVRTFDPKGVVIVDDVIEIEEGKNVIGAITSSLVRDEMLIVGTWSYGSNKQAAGIFSVIVDPFRQQKVNYYDFPMLGHFLDYLKPKRAAKIKAKAEWRKSVGKPVEFRAYVSNVRIEESSDGFQFLAEVYETSTYNPRSSGYPYGYGSSYYNPYGYYPYGMSSMPYRYYSPYNTSPYGSNVPTITTDYRMTSTSVAFFDKQGKLVGDHTMKLPDLKQSVKDQVSDFVVKNGLTTIISKNDENIFVKVSESDGTPVKEEKIKTELKNSNETIRSENQDNSSVRAWYGPYFYVYGYQVLKDNVTKNSRDVFYINKIKVD